MKLPPASSLKPLASSLILPSSQWQDILLAASIAWLLFETWRGWRLGLIRGFLKFAALIAAWFAGSATAAAINIGLLFFFHAPSPLIPSLLGGIVGLGAYVLINFFSALLFKKTDHYHGFLRGFLGLGGACCGILFGLFFLWGGISAIRSLGLVGEVRLLHAEQQGLPSTSDPLAYNLVRLKKSLELGPLGTWFIQVDPLTPAFYENTKKSMSLMKDHEALIRFINTPSTQKLLSNPSIRKIVNDPEVQKAMTSGNIFLLIENKNVQHAFSDPTLWQELKSFDLSAALKQATRQPNQ
ncbi:MAG: hypothetical protein ACOYK6_01415 [Chthoniobacterales bacterium]